MGTDSSVSKVPLPLVLVKTIPGRDPHTGQALIGVDRRYPQTYMAGGFLENGSRIEEVWPDHIVLASGTRRLALYVESGVGRHQAASHETAALAMVGGAEVGKKTISQPTVQPVADYIRATPVYSGDAIAGFAVYPGTRAASFRQWGLQPGDLIVSVDGQPLIDADQAMALLHPITDGESITATVRRGGGASFEVTLDGAAGGSPPGAREVASATP